ncbi:MAG: GDP-mannose 4,6-dehydratase [Chloroflexota bacterium]|nr:GDP-mannose 4,6-dehydratase [Chloroflexota bacterium]
MTHAVVTGGAGFIGSHLVESLLQIGYSVHVIDDLSGGSRDTLSAVHGDPRLQITFDTILNESLMDEIIANADIVFHFAAAVGVQRILARPLTSLIANLRGTDIVLQAADRSRCPIILASTSEVYGKNDTGSLREDADRILGPATLSRWHYATAKAADEALARAYHEEHGLRTMVVRFFNTIGPHQTGQYGMVVPRFVRQALQDAPLTVFGDGQQTRCFTDVRDVVRAVVALAECDAAWGEIINIGGAAEIAIDVLAERIIHLVGSDSEVVHVPYAEAYARGYEDMRRRVPDVSKLRGLIGFAPETDLDETLCRIIQSHQEHVSRQMHAVDCTEPSSLTIGAVTEHLRLAR